jgi:2-haloacid dehalogenase
MSYKIILFDLDDTLIDFAASQKKSLQVVHQQFYSDIKLTHFETCFKTINYALWRQVHLIPASQIKYLRFKQVNAILNAHPDPEQVATVYEEALGLHGAWLPGVEKTIETLHQAGFIMGIITNGMNNTQSLKYQNLGMARWFDCFIVSDQVELAKPDKAIFELARQQLALKHGEAIHAVDPKSILMVGDSLHSDGQGAANAGFSFCWIASKSAKRIEGVTVDHHYASVAELPKFLK